MSKSRQVDWSKPVNRGTCASFFGVQPSTIERWKGNGCPSMRGDKADSTGGRPADKYLVAEVAKWIVQRQTIHHAIDRQVTKTDKVKLEEQLLEQRVVKAKIEVEQKKGALIPRAMVEEIISRFGAVVSNWTTQMQRAGGSEFLDEWQEFSDIVKTQLTAAMEALRDGTATTSGAVPEGAGDDGA